MGFSGLLYNNHAQPLERLRAHFQEKSVNSSWEPNSLPDSPVSLNAIPGLPLC